MLPFTEMSFIFYLSVCQERDGQRNFHQTGRIRSLSPVFDWKVWYILYIVMGLLFVNYYISGEYLSRLPRHQRNPSNKTSRSKKLHSNFVEPNSSQRNLNDKNPPEELIPRQEKLTHDKSNHIKLKNMMCHTRSDWPMVFDPQILATAG